MSKINSKQKGNRFERALAGMFKEYGYEARRSIQYNGWQGEADVVGVPGIHVEAKHCERMQLYDWMSQSIRDTKGDDLPAVFHKRNNHGVLVTMRFDDWMKLYTAFLRICREEQNER